MINEDLQNRHVRAEIEERISSCNRCWECGLDLPFDYAPMLESLGAVGAVQKNVHTHCKSKFLETITVNAYDDYLPVPFRYSVFTAGTIVEERCMVDDIAGTIVPLSANKMINELVYKAPHNIKIEDVRLNQTQFVDQAAVRISLDVRFSPVCFICGSILVMHEHRYSPISIGEDLSSMSATLPVEQQLYTLPDERHYFHKTCMNKLIQNLVIKSY